MAAKAKAAAKRAAAAKKQQSASASNTKSIPIVQHDPTRPPPLHLKDQTIFKQILHLYEIKQYNAALQQCDSLLEKYPGHGETTAMAGLLHHSLNNKAQGYNLVKAGMKADLKSHIVWHVYGIITRADRNHLEAVKSYSQALRLDPENLNILRDLAVLQIQVRQYPAYLESRWKLLRANRRSRTAWLSLSMAYILNHQNDAALEILNQMEKFEVIYEPERSFERSETILLKASLLPPSEALPYLESHSNLILDRTRYMLTRAQHLAELGRHEAAEWAWLDLLDTNEEDRVYLEGYLSNRPQDTSENSVATLKRLSERYPTSQLIRRFILDHAQGTQFDQELESYLCSRLTKGIPSLFNDLKPLLQDLAKLNSIRTIAERLCAELTQNGCFESTRIPQADQPPSTIVWTLLFLSQLYGSPRLNLTKEALETAHQAIQHTPSLPDCYFSLAHIYKRAGSFEKAAEALRSARELDGQDRYLNSKCAKYVLQSIGTTNQSAQRRTQLLKESRELIGLFTRKEAPDPVSDLVDMQAVWYVMAEAEAAIRVSDWALALKRLHQISEIFGQWEEDQYDFHTYCIRKNTFKAYQDLLEFEDRLYTDPLYYKAISKAVQIYLKLHDRITIASKSQEPPVITEYNILLPPTDVSSKDQPSSTMHGDDGPKAEDESTKSKKAQKKAKLAEIKAKAQAALEAKKAMSKNKNAEQANTAAADVVPPIVDDDPSGEKLLKTENPLGVASDLLKPIENNLLKGKSSTDPSKRALRQGVSLCRFEIELRRDKPLLALQALLTAHALSQTKNRIDPPVFLALAKLKSKYLLSQINKNDSSDAESTTVTRILEKGLEKLKGLELPDSYRGRLAHAESLIIYRESGGIKSSNEEIEERIFSLFSHPNGSNDNQASALKSGLSWKGGLDGLRLLERIKSSRVDEFKLKARQLWSLADAFQAEPAPREKAKENGVIDQEPVQATLVAAVDPKVNGSHASFEGSGHAIEIRDF